MPQLSDEEYQRLLGRAQIADFIEPIYNDPQLGREAKALIKKKYPQVQIPDYDIEQSFNERLDKDKQERVEAEKKRAEEENQKAWKQTRANIQKQYGYTEEGMKDLEKLMLERNIGDYEVAAEYHASKNPKQSDANHNDGFWHFQKQDDFADIAKDPEGWAHKEIFGALIRDQEREKGR